MSSADLRQKCLVDGCDGKNEARGVCSPCRQMLYGKVRKKELTAKQLDMILEPEKHKRKSFLDNWIRKRLSEFGLRDVSKQQDENEKVA